MDIIFGVIEVHISNTAIVIVALGTGLFSGIQYLKLMAQMKRWRE